MLEDITDHHERLTDVLVTRLMAQCIVDLLQAVHVTDHNGKIPGLAFGDGGVVFIFAQQVRMLALRAGQRIPERGLFRLIPFLNRLFLPLLHRQVVDQHRCESEHKQDRDNQGIGRINPVDPLNLSLNECPLILRPDAFFCLSVIVFLYGMDRLVCRLLIHTSRPDHGHEYDQGQQGNPDNDRLAKPPGLVILDNPPEVEKTYDSPHHDKDVRFRLQQGFPEQVREKQIDPKDQHDPEADGARDLFPGTFQFFRRFVCCG